MIISDCMGQSCKLGHLILGLNISLEMCSVTQSPLVSFFNPLLNLHSNVRLHWYFAASSGLFTFHLLFSIYCPKFFISLVLLPRVFFYRFFLMSIISHRSRLRLFVLSFEFLTFFLNQDTKKREYFGKKDKKKPISLKKKKSSPELLCF